MHPDALCREERFDSMLSTFSIEKHMVVFFTYERRGRSSEAHLIGSHDNMFLLAVEFKLGKQSIAYYLNRVSAGKSCGIAPADESDIQAAFAPAKLGDRPPPPFKASRTI